MGNGQWAMGDFFHALCPMPHDGRCYNGGNLRNALPPPCPMPHAPCPIPHPCIKNHLSV
ncbi:hypothetical protein [Tolypothrix sp. VBCCA 56010]|uniref:hypothetical protein n=1 Tax=Tolypothrix sp. VBCCA 56010 TaxID=3137731 RepID=UPI003D7D97E4